MKIFPLGWDSEFFRLRIAKAIVASGEDIIALSAQEGKLREQFDLIYIFSEPGLEIPFKQARLVDKKTVFYFPASLRFNINPSIEEWRSLDTTEDLLSLALISGKYSRFKTDIFFPTGSYERLYTQWIKQSVNKTIATEVFCYMIDQTPRGLLTLARKNGNNSIGLVAVDEDYQHRGIGTALVRHAVSYVHDHSSGGIYVATQMDNEPACQLYSKCGFFQESVNYIWHWWL